MKQHKWHKEIKAWADGAEIECKDESDGIKGWRECVFPIWDEDERVEYRIKPQPKETQYLSVEITETQYLPVEITETQYLPVEITETGFTFNCEPLFKAGVLGKYKIKLEVDDE